MPLTRALDLLPSILPRSTVRTDEPHTFTVATYDDGSTDPKYVYQLDKAPITDVEEIEGVHADRQYTFVEGTDYTVIDDNGDGQLDSVDFSIGGSDPDAGTDFEVTYTSLSILNRFVSAHDETLQDIEPDIESVIESRQIDHTSGKDLDRIGALFGELGKRRGRTDDQYRVFLKSIVQTFDGRGTKPGMKFAIAAGIGTDVSNITINEDFPETGYTIQIDNVDTDFLSSVVTDLAELADPSGVGLLAPPVILLDGDSIVISIQGAEVTRHTIGIGGGALQLDGSTPLGQPKADVVATPLTAGSSGLTTTVSTTGATGTGTTSDPSTTTTSGGSTASATTSPTTGTSL